jgi:hypothetical protein
VATPPGISPGMFLVLSTVTDHSAIWAAHQLRKRLRAAVHLVSPQMLFAGAWEHRVGDGPVRTRIRISDSLQIDSAELSGVLNRITYLPESLLPKVRPADRAYATQECTALFMSWMESLDCPVLNRGCAQGLCGAFRPPEHWQVLASQAGLPAGPGTPNAQGVVIGRRWIGPKPEFAPQLIRLAELARTPLLGVEILANGPQWRVVRAHPAPDLTAFGEAAIDALEAALAGGA